MFFADNNNLQSVSIMFGLASLKREKLILTAIFGFIQTNKLCQSTRELVLFIASVLFLHHHKKKYCDFDFYNPSKTLNK